MLRRTAATRAATSSDLSGGTPDPGGVSDVIYAMVLLQGGLGVLASFGMTALMGSPDYLLTPLIKLAVLVVLAAKAAAGRRWAVVTLIAVQAAALAGYGLSVALGLLLPQVTLTVNLAGLLTEVTLPAAILWLCTRLLSARRPRPDAAGVPPLTPSTRAEPTLTSAHAFTRPIGQQR